MPLAVGLFVNAAIEGRSVDNAHLISRKALRAGDNVYLVSDKGQLEIRQVDVMHSTAESAVIASGLARGEKVIVSSIRNPIQGMRLEALVNMTEQKSVATRVSCQPPDETVGRWFELLCHHYPPGRDCSGTVRFSFFHELSLGHDFWNSGFGRR